MVNLVTSLEGYSHSSFAAVSTVSTMASATSIDHDHSKETKL